MRQNDERELDRLFAACRNAFDDVEPSEAYVPGVWRKIEEARPGADEVALDQLFARARTSFAADEVEPSTAYLPALWRKIEAARPLTAEQEVERVFARARVAYEDPEPSVNFMPHLWRKIEAARPLDDWLEWVQSWAPRLACAGALAAGMLIAAVWTQPSMDSVALEADYVDHLTEESLDEHDAALWTSVGLRR